jgi:hypothetical protein
VDDNKDLVIVHCLHNQPDGCIAKGLIQSNTIEYIYDPRNDVIYRLLNNYAEQTCPVFIFDEYMPSEGINYLVDSSNYLNIAVRELPSNLSYLPGLIGGLGGTILALFVSTLIALYINSKTSNKNVFIFRLICLMCAFPLMMANVINILFKLMGIGIIDRIILNRIKSTFSKLQDNKQYLVANLEYILEKVKQASSTNDYNITSKQAHDLIHDKDFKERYTNILLNIRLVKIYSYNMKTLRICFLIPSMRTPEAVLDFKDYLDTEGPMLYNHHVKTGLTNFRELYNDFSSSSFTTYNSDSTSNTLLGPKGFIREHCYIKFMENF